MPVLVKLRQSPTYLYIKVYLICSLVSLFQAAPISSRIARTESWSLSRGPNDNATAGRATRILARWRQRAEDMAAIEGLMKRDDQDLVTYPELAWDAKVRRSSQLHPAERRFISQRTRMASREGNDALRAFLGLPEAERVHPDDVPLVALGGSGGGYRAMYGFAGFLAASKRTRLWDCLTWTAGVSGSCWTLAAYYTIAYHDTARLVQHYLATARERTHPMSIEALDTVARSSKGVYFLLAPLLRKAQGGLVGLGMMDLYATLTTSYQFLSREPRARLSRATFQLSKIWQRSGLASGMEPMPLFTAVRVAPRDSTGVKQHRDSSMSKGQPPPRALVQHKTPTTTAIVDSQSGSNAVPDPSSTDVLALPVPRGFFQWFEISPLEIGSTDVQAYVPTWSWGRAFVSGRSLQRTPECSMSLILGQCTSAPAGPLTGYVSALLASLPRGTVMSRLLMFLNDFIRLKRWERRWGNPIRAGDEPNPFYGLTVRPEGEEQLSGDGSGPGSRGGSQVLGVGIDILHLPRLERLLQRHTERTGSRTAALNRLAQRILCSAEQREWQTMQASSPETRVLSFLAVRWAAKEAAYKALYPVHVVSWKHLCLDKPISSSFDVAQREHQGERSKKPRLRLSDEWLAAHRDVDVAAVPQLHFSASHDGEYVVANVLAIRGGAVEIEAGASRAAWSQLELPPLSDSEKEAALAGADITLTDTAPSPLDEDGQTKPAGWETSSRIRLMDSGMSNNLPNHVLARPERGADVIIAFDASSDVQKGSALQRIRNFADDCGIALRVVEPSGERTTGSEAGQSQEAREIEERFRDRYAQRIEAWRLRQGEHDEAQRGQGLSREADLQFVYCPLLPNSVQPDYDPSTAPFSNSYNLVWTPEQVETIVRTSSANLERHAIHTIRQTMLEVYQRKKAARLARERRQAQQAGREAV